MKTSELTGAALDWAVAYCEGLALVDGCLFTKDPDDEQVFYSPSTDWSQAGPIIELENIATWPDDEEGGWFASSDGGRGEDYKGNTPLIAAMRCYLALKWANEIEIPKELA